MQWAKDETRATPRLRCAAIAALLLVAGVATLAGPNAARAASLLTNGSFESTGSGWLSPWYLGVKPGGAGSASQTGAARTDGSYSALVNVTTASAAAPWVVQLSQPGLPITGGQTYTVSFAAKASAPRSIDAVIQKSASPYTELASRRVALTTAWQTFSFSYAAVASDPNGSLHFNVGAATGSVWIDAVSMESSATPPPAPSSLTPIADTWVQSTYPSTNYGSATVLRSKGQPAIASYMKFDLGPLSGQAIASAKLRMKVTNTSSSTHALRPTPDNSWTEAGITYANRPSLGSALATFGGGTAGSWVEVDVTGALSGKAGQLVTLGIDSAGSDAYAFYSRDSATDAVRLVVDARDVLPPPSPAAGGKGVALRPFAQYWGGNVTGMNGDFGDMRAGNITWARIDLYRTDQPDPAFDAAVQAARSHGVNLLVTVRKPAPDRDLGTDADRAAYRAWLAQMVNRYKYHVKHWEIHNEPNLHYDWNIDDSNGSDPARYANSVRRYVLHLEDGYETVKANDPGATVLFGGLSEWTVERYMDVLVTTDAYRYFDVMSFHPYGYNPDRVLSRFNSFRSKMNLRSTYASKPIWVTETGFNTSWSNKAGYVTSEGTKADYLQQTLRLLRGAGAQLPIFWYTLHENDAQGGYGLTIKNKSSLATQYLPAFYRYRDLAL